MNMWFMDNQELIEL